MKKVLLLTAIFILLTFLSFLHADQPKLTITFQEIGSRLTEQERNFLKTEVEKAFPGALEQLVKYLGTEEVRKDFQELKVAIYDYDGNLSFGVSYNSRYGRQGPPGVTLFANVFLANQRMIKEVLFHEMIHAAYEKRISFSAYRHWPEVLVEGLAYFGSNEVEANLVAFMNGLFVGDKEIPAIEIIAKNSENAKWVRKVSFGFCYQSLYGAKAWENVVRQLYQGKDWKETLEKNAGETWTIIEGKTRNCLVEKLYALEKSKGDFAMIEHAFRQKNWLAITATAQAIEAKDSSFLWRIAAHYRNAQALANLENYGLACEEFEKICNGGYGQNFNIQNMAGFRLVSTMMKQKKCTEARDKMDGFSRLYPKLQQEYRDDFDRDWRKYCTQSVSEK